MANAVKELARAMATPCKGDMESPKRLGRYLRGKPRLVQWFNWQPAVDTVVTYSDVGWVGCKATRKSTTGGCIKTGARTIKAWNTIQFLVALSSGESELYASLKAAAETLGVISMAKDSGWELQVYGDASAALGIIHRRGLRKTFTYRQGCYGCSKLLQSKGSDLERCGESKILPTYSPSTWMKQRARPIPPH